MFNKKKKRKRNEILEYFISIILLQIINVNVCCCCCLANLPIFITMTKSVMYVLACVDLIFLKEEKDKISLVINILLFHNTLEVFVFSLKIN